jgi:hypothetical protein
VLRSSADLSGADLDRAVHQQIAQYAQRVQYRSREAVRQSARLQELAAHWRPDRLGVLPADTIAMWQQMIRDHARGIAQLAEAQRLELRPLFGEGPPVALASGEAPLAALRDVEPLAAQLADAVREADRLVQRWLTDPAAASETASAATAAAPVPLLVALSRAQALASQFAGPWNLNP